MLSLDQAKSLTYGQIMVTDTGKRLKVNGKVKTWKRSPEKVQIPYKYGLYDYGYVLETDLEHIERIER